MDDNRIKSLQDQLDAVESQLKNPLPTPHIGASVWWYEHGQVSPDNVMAAVVTAIEGPARVTLAIFPPRGMMRHKSGVHWARHPQIASKVHDPTRLAAGVWEYPDGSHVRKQNFEVHEQQLLKRKLSIIDQMRQIQDIAALREAANAPPTPGLAVTPAGDPDA